MKNFTKIASVGVLFIASSFVFTAQARAEQVSIEQQMTEMVATQGQKLIQDLHVTLQQSIQAEIKNFSIEPGLLWLDESAQVEQELLITDRKNSQKQHIAANH